MFTFVRWCVASAVVCLALPISLLAQTPPPPVPPLPATQPASGQAAAGQPAPGLPATISGQVRQAGALKPIKGATVLVEGTSLTATTDGDGRFSLPAVPPGEH